LSALQAREGIKFSQRMKRLSSHPTVHFFVASLVLGSTGRSLSYRGKTSCGWAFLRVRLMRGQTPLWVGGQWHAARYCIPLS